MAAHIPAADKARAAIAANINGDGYLTNVVDPNNFGSQGDTSPEGQAFVLMMEAAYRDYVAWNATGFASTRIVVTGKKCQLSELSSLLVAVSCSCCSPEASGNFSPADPE